MFIHEVCKKLEEAKVSYAIVGGFAVALHGALRGTVDVDIAIVWTLENLKKAESLLKGMGLVSLLPINSDNLYNFKDEYIQNRNLISWNFYDPKNPARQVDIIINYDLKNKHTKTIHTPTGDVMILSRRELIEMKRASGRPQDIADIEALEDL